MSPCTTLDIGALLGNGTLCTYAYIVSHYSVSINDFARKQILQGKTELPSPTEKVSSGDPLNSMTKMNYRK